MESWSGRDNCLAWAYFTAPTGHDSVKLKPGLRKGKQQFLGRMKVFGTLIDQFFADWKPKSGQRILISLKFIHTTV